MPTSQDIIENKGYTLIRLNKNNLKDLAILHSEVYGTPVNDNYFLKKYDTAYTGVENVGYIAYSSDRKPVAYYGVIPCFVEHKNEVMLAAQSADTMTHPGYRYKGMFVELSNKAFELCRQLGIRLVFGFPNQNSYHGAINKLGWKMTEAMSCFIIPVRTLPIERLAHKLKMHGVYKRYARFMIGKERLSLHGTANSVIMDGFAGVNRSEEYLAYKTYNPSRVIEIAKTKIWISERPGMLIGDMENVDESNFQSAIKGLKRLAGKLGVRQIQFHCSPDTRLHDLFATWFEKLPSYPVLFQDFGSSIAPASIKFTFADIDIF